MRLIPERTSSRYARTAKTAIRTYLSRYGMSKTRRLKNDPNENRVYSWKKPDKPQTDDEWVEVDDLQQIIPF